MAKGGYRGGMPMGGMNQMQMMKQAQKMQENLMKMQEELQAKEYEATACGGVIKPDVVLYEEPLDENVMIKAIHYIRQADVLLIGGTSLVVYPAAGLVTYYRGHKLAVINKGGAGGGLGAAVTVDGPIGQVLAQL